LVRVSTAPFGDAAIRRLPSRQIRRCRRRFRTTTTGRTRTPSIGLTRALRPGRARPRLLFTRVVPPRTLSLAASLAAVPGPQPFGWTPFGWSPASSKAGVVASSYLAPPRGPTRRCQHEDPRDAARKMRLTDFCNRLSSRAPTDCPIPGALSSRGTSFDAPCLACGLTLGRNPAAVGWEPADQLAE